MATSTPKADKAAAKKPTSRKETAAVQEQKAAVDPGVPAPTGFAFATETNSPFSDGYSIAGEEAALAEFLAGPMDETDPMYDRYIELEDRKDRLERMQAEFQGRKGANAVVSREEARGMDELGVLVDEEVDQMSIHTKEAYRMFMGRMREPGKEAAPIVGGKRVAAALRGLWLLTGNDNPYADWALLRHEQTIKEIQRRLQRETREANSLLADLRKKGLSYSILQSAEPKVLNLGYRSPYGYAVSQLIVEFDYFVRVQKTLARKTLLSDEQARQAITEMTRFIRRVFNETTRFDRWLSRTEVRALSRADFLPDADEQAAKRVEFATGVFGVVPAEVFSAQMQPRHSRRRQQITHAERQLLHTVGAQLEAAEQELEQTNADQVAATPGEAHSADANLV